MTVFPYLSASELAASFWQRAEMLAADAGMLLPKWARDNADNLIRTRKFIICGTACPEEMRTFMRSAEVIAIVDDTLCRKQSRLYDIPVIDSDTWVEMARKDRSIISCILTIRARGFQHFVRLGMQWEIPFLDTCSCFTFLP
jgi:hypothetical protein